MLNGLSRIRLPLLALSVLGLTLLGFFAACATAPTTAKAHAIVVGPMAKDLTIPVLHMSRGRHDVVFWASSDSTKKLYIEFTDEPFQNMTRQGNGRFQVQCQGRQCYSDEIKPDAPYGPHKYWQILDKNGNKEEADGIIIIDP